MQNAKSETIFPIVPPHPRTQALTSTTFDLPPLDGSLTIPEIYDWHLTHTPDHTLFEYADNEQIKVIKWPQAVRAIHKTSTLIRRLMRSSLDKELDSEERKTVIAVVASPGQYFHISVVNSFS